MLWLNYHTFNWDHQEYFFKNIKKIRCCNIKDPHWCCNQKFEKCFFPNNLKKGCITAIYKKDEQTNKKNYRPISILPSVSQIYERLIDNQVGPQWNTILFPELCGFWKGYRTQHALINFLEKWKTVLDNKDIAGAILMDLSDAFDCINHDLPIAKLYANGFGKYILYLLYSYWTGKKQKVKINCSFSNLNKVSHWVPQGSV